MSDSKKITLADGVSIIIRHVDNIIVYTGRGGTWLLKGTPAALRLLWAPSVVVQSVVQSYWLLCGGFSVSPR